MPKESFLILSNQADVETSIHKAALEKKFIQILKYFNRPLKPVELTFLNSEEMKQLNKRFRSKAKTTDVLSFNYSDMLVGSIAIDPCVAQKQATEYGHSFQQEIKELFVHGCLHLLGFDHESQRQASLMAAYEAFFLK